MRPPLSSSSFLAAVLNNITTKTLLLLCFSGRVEHGHGLLSSPLRSSVAHVVEHLLSPPLLRVTPLEDLANTRIPGPDGVEILAFVARPQHDNNNNNNGGNNKHVLLLLHEFFGLSPSVVDKAQGLADDLGCVVVAPDTFRGVVTDFIPRAIWLALSTPQARVNDDLDAVCDFLVRDATAKVAVMGFCYGGGKALRYALQRRTDAATVVCYGQPVTDAAELGRLRAPVCGVYGRNDGQFSTQLVDGFRRTLGEAGVVHDVRVYDDVGHAFWTDMAQVRGGGRDDADDPKVRAATGAYRQCREFLRTFFDP